MLVTFIASKIHRATVTHADLDYVGSITIDRELLDASGIFPGQQVHVVDIANGNRLITYAIEGEAGSGVIGINGAAAHLVAPGDLVIIMAYAQGEPAEAKAFTPKVVHVDDHNHVVQLGSDLAAPDEHSVASPHAL